MANKFKEILTSGAESINSADDNEKTLLVAKLIYKRLENEIIRVAALATVDADGNITPTSKEELLKL